MISYKPGLYIFYESQKRAELYGNGWEYFSPYFDEKKTKRTIVELNEIIFILDVSILEKLFEKDILKIKMMTKDGLCYLDLNEGWFEYFFRRVV